MYGYWTWYHDRYRVMCIWHGQKLCLLEQTIRRKWKKVKDLPLVNVIFKKFKGKGTFFNPEIYLEED